MFLKYNRICFCFFVFVKISSGELYRAAINEDYTEEKGQPIFASLLFPPVKPKENLNFNKYVNNILKNIKNDFRKVENNRNRCKTVLTSITDNKLKRVCIDDFKNNFPKTNFRDTSTSVNTTIDDMYLPGFFTYYDNPHYFKIVRDGPKNLHFRIRNIDIEKKGQRPVVLLKHQNSEPLSWDYYNLRSDSNKNSRTIKENQENNSKDSDSEAKLEFTPTEVDTDDSDDFKSFSIETKVVEELTEQDLGKSLPNNNFPRRFKIVNNEQGALTAHQQHYFTSSEEVFDSEVELDTLPPKKKAKKTPKKSAKPIDQFVYLQGPKRIINLNFYSDNEDERSSRMSGARPGSRSGRRSRLDYFLPKRFYWDVDDLDNLGYYWFNGLQGRETIY